MYRSSSDDLSFCPESYRTHLAESLGLISDDNLRQLFPEVALDEARKVMRNPRVLPVIAHIAADRGLPLPVPNKAASSLLHTTQVEILVRIITACVELTAQEGVLSREERKRLVAVYGEDLLSALWGDYESLIKPFKSLLQQSVYQADLVRLAELARDEGALQRGIWSGAVSRQDFNNVGQIRRVLAKLATMPPLNILASATEK